MDEVNKDWGQTAPGVERSAEQNTPTPGRKNTMAEIFDYLDWANFDNQIDTTKAERKLRDAIAAAEKSDERVNAEESDDFAHVKVPIKVQSRIMGRDIEKEEYAYESFGPPSFFESPFAICFLEIKAVSKDWMSHAGEEIVIVPEDSPVGLGYQFHRRHSPEAEENYHRIAAVPGSCVRISPSQLHRNTLVEKDGSEVGIDNEGRAAAVWFLLRPENRHVPSLLVTARSKQEPSSTEPGDQSKVSSAKDDKNLSENRLRRLPAYEPNLLSPARYLMLVSGILEKIRDNRQAAEYTTQELSDVLGFSRTYLTHLGSWAALKESAPKENRDRTNYETATIGKIAAEIDIDLAGMLRNLRWTTHRQKLWPKVFEQSAGSPKSLEKPLALEHHLLHPKVLRLEPTHGLIQFDAFDKISLSIVVLLGTINVVYEDSAKKSQSIAVNVKEAFHARRNFTFKLQAISPADILIVECSEHCSCMAAGSE